MALRLPPLSSLRLFEAAGRHQGFKRAAEELNLTPSAVSHGVMALEQWLGVELFERGPRGVSLTEAGRSYLPFVSEALAMIAVGTRRIAGGAGTRRVSISVAPTFAARWLIPRLGEFRQGYPDIALSIDASHRQVGFPVDDVDLAIRMGRAPWPELVSTHLFSEQLVPVCSPAFRALHGKDGNPDLAPLPLIHVETVTEDWAAWAEAVGMGAIDPAKGLHVDTIHMALTAAKAGFGVAIGRRPLVDPELDSGELVPAGQEVSVATGYWLIEAPQAQGRPEIAAFAEWLAHSCRLTDAARMN
jgi:DNA-binding transcriptional LysR family regulator